MAQVKAWFRDDVKREKFLTAVRSGATDLQAADAAGFHFAQLVSWMDSDDVIRQQIEEARTNPETPEPSDDPWWAIGRIVEAKDKAAFMLIEQGLTAYETGRVGLATWLGGEVCDGPDDDPFWALGRIVETKAPHLFEHIESGLAAYANGPSALLAHLAKPAPKTAAGAARASFVGVGTAPDQRDKARVALACVVEFATEQDQLNMLTELSSRGFRCRALI